MSLHRVDDPLGEARAQLATCGARNPRIIAIVGAGLGYLTQAAHERFPDARIVVLEPLPLLAQQAQLRTPRLYESDRVRLLSGATLEGAGDLWRLFDVEDPDEPDPALLLNPALQRVIPAGVATAVLMVRRATRGARMNARARRDNAGRYVVNTLRNLPHIIKGVDPQRLVGQFTGVPAVLVAAGPSLDQNLPALSRVADRALVVATDTSWRPLVAAGIDPHLVISLDPSTLNGRHLTGVTSRRDTWIFAEGSVEPDALRAFVGRVGTFRVGMHHPWPWLTELGVTRPLAQVWGSVLTAAFDLSLAFGCDPLVFVGADLAFTDRRPYCRGTTFEEMWARHAAAGVSLRQVWHNSIAARASMQEVDLRGQRTLTAANLVEFRNWLVMHSNRQTNRRVINATGAGILFGPGIDQADIETALEPYPERGESIRDSIRRLLSLRTVSVHLRDVMQSLATIASTDDGAGPAQSPVEHWVAFGKPALTSADLRSAARDGLVGLQHACPPQDAIEPPLFSAAPRLRLHEADRVALIRALLTGDHAVLDGCQRTSLSQADSGSEKWTSAMASVLSELLSMPRLIEGPGEAVASGAAAAAVPLSCRYVWTPVAAPWIAALEELQLESAPQSNTSESAVAENGFWSGSISPVIDHVEGIGESPDHERHIRLELTSLRLGLLATERQNRRDGRLMNAILRGISDAALCLPRPSSYRLELSLQSRTVDLPVRIDTLMRALTGTVAFVNPPGPPAGRAWPQIRAVAVTNDGAPDPRLTFLKHDFDYLEPVVLTGDGLRPGFSLHSAGDDRVVFAPSGATESVLIASNGAVTRGQTWPGPITGEIPWGDAGGALAWNSRDSTVLLRRERHGSPVIETAPFRPVRVATSPDGAVLWSAAGGGVWRWLPGQSGEHILHLPTWGIIFIEDGELVLPAVLRDDDRRVRRQRVQHEWRANRDGSRLRLVDGAPEGQCFSHAQRGGWSARAYPFSDLVRLRSATGHALSLACHAPTAAVWAGNSLLVNTSDGEVLVWCDLLDRLSRLGPAGAPL